MAEPAEGQVPAGDFEPALEESPPPTEVAKEVIAGHWGRGLRRDKRLRDAGYDPKKVKAEIVRILHQR